MPLGDFLAIEVGTAIAKLILKLWLKDTDIVVDVSTTILDILKSRTKDRIAQQKAQRQLQEIGEQVGESLFPIFETDGRGLDEGSRLAVALVVEGTLNIANISSELLVRSDLEPSKLAKYLLGSHYTTTQYFNETEKLLYQRIIFESCEYIVNIASRLPTFPEHSFAEMLRRESQLLIIAEQTLQEVRLTREQLNPTTEAAHFELEYRRAVIRNLNILQLFGVSAKMRRHRLSTAYVRLSLEQTLVDTPQQSGQDRPTTGLTGSKDKASRRVVSVDEVLADSHRLFIRGPAGSGKTTLLQWIAVNSAQRSFKGPLVNWNNTLPFYIRLRHYIQSGLPTPEAFPNFVAATIVDMMPKGWVHIKLASGQGLVLVDGLDEVPALQREDVHMWLRNLLDTYPDVRFIITSRPHAVEGSWKNLEGFNTATLQPMELPDIRTFIDHWHAATAEELDNDKEKAELPSFAKHLKEEVQYKHSQRNLATNPLLCAMLCTLNREREQQLPSDRIQLYEACCELLIERREKEQRLNLISDYSALALTYRQKRALLEGFAYWLIRNGWSAVESQPADEHFARKLTNMRNIPQNVSGIDIRRLLVERTGIIREPIVGQIDFTHRTFQEFLAAKAILDEEDTGILGQHANDDQWREVIILASGLATRKVSEKLIQELITKGDSGKGNRYQLHLLAVSCLETTVNLGPQVTREVQKRLSALIPPKTITDVQSLASAGDLAVPYLLKSKQYTASINTACIRTLALIGSDTALDALEGYADDTHSEVVDELLKAWDRFDRNVYAQRILSQALRGKYEVSKLLTSLHGFQYFTKLTELEISDCDQIKDLSPLANLTQLTSLSLAGCKEVSDLSPLASLTQLTSLDLQYCMQVRDLRPLAYLKQLTSLNLTNCKLVKDITPLEILNNLKTLQLYGIYEQVFIPKSLQKRVNIWK